jgi:hypothetical protein
LETTVCVRFVVADPRSVREQLLDRDAVVDQRQVRAEDRAGRGGQRQQAAVDERQDAASRPSSPIGGDQLPAAGWLRRR